MKPKSIRRLSVLTTFAFAASAHAATYNWQGDTSSVFDEPTNWVEGTWTQWGDYRFGAAAVSGAVDLNGVFGGGNWYLDSGLAHDITVAGSQSLIMAPAWSLGGLISIDTNARDLTINTPYDAVGAVTWSVGANRNLTLNSILRDWNGAASLVKQGSGTAVLQAANTYSGGTTLSGGTLRLENTSALGSGGLGMVNNTTLQLRSDTDATFAGGNGLGGLGNASITFDVNQLTSGNSNKTLSFASGGFDTYNTTINATGGNGYTLALGGINNGYFGPISLNADTANLTIGNLGSSSASSSLNVGGAATTTITGAINTGGNFTKTGSGTLNLTGTSSFATVMIFAGGVVNASTVANNGTNSSLGAGTGDPNADAIGLVFRGGTLQYTGSSAQSTDRAIRLSTTGGGGTIDASGSNPAATLSFTASSSPNFFENPGNRTLTLTGTNTGDNTFAMAIGEAGGTTSLVKSGNGKWVLTGANTYSGTTTVSGGILSVTNPALNDGSSVVIDSGATLNLDFSGNDVIGSLEINGSGPLPGGIYNSSHLTYGSYFTGTGSLKVLDASGTWTSLVDGNWKDEPNWLANTIANGFDQTATFNAATGVTVTLSGGQTIGNLAFAVSDYTLVGSGTLTLESSGIPGIGVTTGNTATIDANLGGTIGLEKTGDGTLVFTGTKSYTGGTTVTGGTLELSGATAGNAQIHGSLTVSPGATVSITNGDGTGFGFFNNPVNFITVNGGTLSATSGSHLGFGSSTSLSLENGGLIDGAWQWNGDSLLGFSSSGASTNTISGSLNLRGDSSLDHTFYVEDGAASTDLLVSANLDDRHSPLFLWERSNLIKSGPGTMVLSGANTCYGNTVVNDGALQVTAAGSLRFGPTTNSVTNSVSGTALASLSFLGTVDLDLTAADTTTGNTWNLFNLGSFATAPSLIPAAVTSGLGSFTEVTPGVWELPATGAKWVFTETNGDLTYTFTATDYDTWKTDNGVIGGENDDDDNDGLTNHEEYAFGLDPAGGSSSNPITVELSKTTGTFTYTRRNTTKTDLTYTVWTSTNLVNWSPATVSENVTGPVADVETVQATLSPIPTEPKLFIQVRAN
jgi:autotransporter-associated beta strand protein